MKNLYSYKELSHYLRKVMLFLMVILCIGSYKTFAEGTKQLAPKSTDRVYTAFSDAKHGNFGNYNSTDTERIYIHVQNPTDEVIYFGFSQFVNSGHANSESMTKVNAWMRIKDPNGNVVWPNAGSHNGEKVPGNMITSLGQVKNGPNQLCGSGGYNAFAFYPTSGTGDYYIEFSAAEASEGKRPIYTEWWDITVATKGAGSKAIDGRVYAKQWALVSPRISMDWYDRDFNGKVYSYAESTSYSGGYVTEVDFENSGFRGARFNIAFNSTGTDNTLDFEVNRKSLENENKLSPEYKIFLNEPDVTAFPSADGYGKFIVDEENDYPRLFGCPGKYFFRVAVENKGRIDLLLDFEGTPNKFDPGTRDRIITTLSVPFPNEEGILIRDIAWDGLDGKGNVVTDFESISMIFDYFQGTFHFPMYDVEHLTTGLVPRTVRPETPTPYVPKLYWDDRNISENLPDGQLKVDLTGDVAPSHNWLDYDYGNENSINTYWHSYSSGVTKSCQLNLPDHGCDLFTPGTISGTVFEDIDQDGVMDVGELPFLGAEVRLYWDKDYDKSIGGSDELVETFITKLPGSFGFPEGLGNYVFSPEIGKQYLVEVSFGSNVITGENPRSYKFYSSGVDYFDQLFGVVPLKVSLSVSKPIIQEDGESSEIVVELDYPTHLPVTINLAYGGTAEASDYDLTPGSHATTSILIEIPVGESSGVVTLTSIHDNLNESDETVSIDIISSENAVKNGEQSKVITIIDGNSPIGDLVDDDSDANSLSENAKLDDLVHITALATDDDGDTITYFLLDNAGGRFKINETTGVVSVADASLIDFETDEFHIIRIEARSTDTSVIAGDFQIDVTDVDGTGGDTDNAIANLRDSDTAANSLSENAKRDDLVHITALATDDDGDNITYVLLNDAGGRFTIHEITGIVTVANAGLIDFETDEFHNIRIEARSTDESVIAADFRIDVTDVDGTGGDTDNAIANLRDSDTDANSLSENAKRDDLVHITALATDDDGDTITYFLLDNAGGRFKIHEITGIVTVANAGLIDFETDEFHNIRIEARSTDESVIAADFRIDVTDVDGTGG
ncbi:cadherin repeat domain-containing protein, partial [Ancylomarina sp. YFZ004]